MEQTSGGARIVESLVDEGVRHLFGVCGHGILGLLDAAYDVQDALKTVTCHDEQVAGFMADAYYRVARKPAATYSSCGPGSVNLTMALASAFMDSSAFLAITGNVPTQQFNRGPFQESARQHQNDFLDVYKPYVKRSFQAFRADMVSEVMRMAFGVMTEGRTGPVHVDVPLNVFVERSDAPRYEAEAWRRDVYSRGQGAPAGVARAVELLSSAARPVVVAGHGAVLAGAGASIRALADAMNAPIVTTPLAKGLFDEYDTMVLGITGRNGTAPANLAARQADVIVAFGTRFDDRTTSGWIAGATYEIPPSRLIHVDIDANEIGRNYPATVGIVGDATLVANQLHDALPAGTDVSEWPGRIARWQCEWRTHVDAARASSTYPVHPSRLVAALEATIPDGALVLADVGIHHNWLLQQLRMPRGGQFLQSWGFAAMGFGVAGALGAAFAARDRPVIAICGDGGMLMTANALATAAEYDLPCVWIVWNNLGYESIRAQQLAFFGADREHATRFRHDATGELQSVDFVRLAQSLRVDGVRAESTDEIADLVTAATAAGRPTLIEVAVDVEHPSPATGQWALPPLPSPPMTYPSSPRPGGDT